MVGVVVGTAPVGTAAGARAAGAAGRWVSADRVTPGPAGHDGYDLRDVFLDVVVRADGRFHGAHTAYLLDAKAPDAPWDPARFAYRRSHVLLGVAEGRLDLAAGSGWVRLGGYGATEVSVTGSEDRLELRMATGVVAHRPVMFTRAVLLARGRV